MLYKSKAWALSKGQSDQIRTAEMRFVRDCRLLDRITNENIRSYLQISVMEVNAKQYRINLCRRLESLLVNISPLLVFQYLHRTVFFLTALTVRRQDGFQNMQNCLTLEVLYVLLTWQVVFYII